jgi:hypothetical protein
MFEQVSVMDVITDPLLAAGLVNNCGIAGAFPSLTQKDIGPTDPLFMTEGQETDGAFVT